MLSFFLQGMGRYTKLFRHLTIGPKNCTISPQKRREIQLTKKIIGKSEQKHRILSSAGAIINLVAPGRKLYQLVHYSRETTFFDYLVIETANTSDTYPIPGEELKPMIERCRPFAEKVLMETAFFFIAKGKFTEECLQQNAIYNKYGQSQKKGDYRPDY